MALKTFNIDEATYKEFSAYCKKHGISMSKRVEHFIIDELEKLQGKKRAPLPTSHPTSTPNTLKEKQVVSVQHHSFSKYC